jgi:crotonobetainyl-CoA:carnitine CoA-transferase CaiB-like acyl-CoA transferase
MGALDGLLVVALEQAVAAPLASARLAEAGARVIKIERAEGDFARGYDHVVHGESAYFVWLNRGKESLVLDIKAPADAALLERLLARADVFIQNLAPGAAARAGFGSAALRARYPRLITCDISGYGEAGPARDMKAYDLLIQCETGLASITGSAAEPGRVGVSVADIACGMNAHAAILEALIARSLTGEGRGIAVSLFDSIADWMTVPLLHHDHGGAAPARVGLQHPSIAPYGAFTCGDGRQVVIAIQNDREWRRLCDGVLGDSAMAADPRFGTNSLRVANRPALDGAIARIFAGIDAATAIARLGAAGIAFGAVNDVAGLSRHAQLRRAAADTPSGPVLLPARPAVVAGEAATRPAVPALGAATAAIRAEFGLG